MLSLAFTSAPASINALAALILLLWVAINSAVRPSRSLVSMLTPSDRRSLIVATSSFQLADFPPATISMTELREAFAGTKKGINVKLVIIDPVMAPSRTGKFFTGITREALAFIRRTYTMYI
jgi:hypothetical protein